ncbi:MAG: DNA circularization N-terminal domain-containing protein [Deltaproteobacteria bacterium]|nr:DNA circularization N-terminal domain-containing protein [Deltaproteobacteria bacterium]
MTEDYDAYIDQFYLHIETIEDGFEKAIVEHEFPGTDGALVEDMGQKARRITVKCYFINEYYENHFDFIEHLEKKELFEFSHPKYGSIFGTIKSVNIRHDDRQRTAAIDLTFVENLRSKAEPLLIPDVEATVEKTVVKGIEEQSAVLEKAVVDSAGPEGKEIINRPLDPAKGIIEQFPDIRGKARAYVKTIDKHVKALEGKLTEIETSANSLVAKIEFETSLKGRVLSAVTKTVERYSEQYKTAKESASRYERSFRKGMDELERSLETGATGIFNEIEKNADNIMKIQVKAAAGLRMGLDLGYIYAKDQEKRLKVKYMEGKKSFDDLGNYIKNFSIPQLLPIDDIETSLANSREYLQSLIDSDRSIQSLKEMALALQEHVWKVKVESENLVNITLDNDIPIHLACHMQGLAYNFADRILAVNRISNPNLIKGDMKIYAR